MSDTELCRKWADLYRMRGFNPLPSRTDSKRPLVRFAQWWTEQAPEDLFDKHPTSNIQVMAGRHWGLLIIDLDGDEAKERFAKWGRTPRTWVTHSGGNGEHLWFKIPTEGKPLPKAFLWKGKDGQHSAIERLCDHSLIMAPPSIHPKTGERYRFRSKGESPLALPLPATCPMWVLNLKPTGFKIPSTVSIRGDLSQLIDAIPHKIDLARSWGVRFSGRPSPKGWWPCHAIGRDDRTPSAAIQQDSGFYVDQGSGDRFSFIDLGIRLGAFVDFKDAMERLGVKHAG